ncbi:hypothetical protein AAMO2058_001501200 [Amorphochlora amoebiformis]
MRCPFRTLVRLLSMYVLTTALKRIRNTLRHNKTANNNPTNTTNSPKPRNEQNRISLATKQNKHKRASEAKTRNQVLVLVVTGPSGSGKSTLAKSFKKEWIDRKFGTCVVISQDCHFCGSFIPYHKAVDDTMERPSHVDFDGLLAEAKNEAEKLRVEMEGVMDSKWKGISNSRTGNPNHEVQGQGQEDAQGQGQEDAQGQGQGEGEGQDDDGKGQGDGKGHGQCHGQGQGQNDGKVQHEWKGQGYGQGRGDAEGQGHAKAAILLLEGHMLLCDPSGVHSRGTLSLQRFSRGSPEILQRFSRDLDP